MTVRGLLRRRRRRTRGSAAMMFGFLLPVFVGLMGLSVDMAVIATARSQLSTAADAAAMAGAQQLANEYRVRGTTNLTSTITAANAQVAAFTSANSVLGQTVSVVQNTGNTAGTGDVLVGYINPATPTLGMDS